MRGGAAPPWPHACGPTRPRHAVRVMPSASCRPSRAVRVLPSEPCRPSHAVPVMPSEPCRPSHAVRVMPSESCRPSQAVRVMPSEPRRPVWVAMPSEALAVCVRACQEHERVVLSHQLKNVTVRPAFECQLRHTGGEVITIAPKNESVLGLHKQFGAPEELVSPTPSNGVVFPQTHDNAFCNTSKDICFYIAQHTEIAGFIRGLF